jgi:hypothetical protein
MASGTLSFWRFHSADSVLLPKHRPVDLRKILFLRGAKKIVSQKMIRDFFIARVEKSKN